MWRSEEGNFRENGNILLKGREVSVHGRTIKEKMGG